MKTRENITFGILLILIGGALIARQFYPSLEILFQWPYWGIAAGVLLIGSSAILQEGGWAILGSLLAGVAVNVLLRERLGAGLWVSMLAFLGLGIMLADLVDKQGKSEWRSGLALIFIAVILFLISGSTELLPWPQLTSYWPLALILIGVAFIVTSLSDRKKKE
ncbi:MAG: hypothetical protein WA110_01085 [Anaerolineaceae bacterium]